MIVIFYRFLEPTEQTFTSPLPMLPSPRDEYLGPNVSAAHGSKSRHALNITGNNSEKGPLLDYTTALTLTVAIGLSLLVLNVILFAALLYRRDRNQMGAKITYDSVSVQPLCTVDSGLRSGSSVIHESLSSPGKEMITTCSEDIQVTELHTFPTPPDIGDRNTEVTSYTSVSGSKRHGCSGMPTSQFVPPPPLMASTSTASAHQTQLEGDKNLPIGNVIGRNTGGVLNSPCTSSACYPERTSSPYRSDAGSYSDVHIPGNTNQNFQVNISSSCNPNSNVTSAISSGSNVSSINSCSKVGACQMPEQNQNVTNFPSSPNTYCPPSQYCNEFPISQYPTERFTNSPIQYIGPSCQFSNESNCSKFLVDQNQRHSSGTGSILGLRSSDTGANVSQRSATLTRATPSAGPSTVCLQNIRKPKPPPRDSSSGPGFATLPRQSSLDSSTHIVA